MKPTSQRVSFKTSFTGRKPAASAWCMSRWLAGLKTHQFNLCLYIVLVNGLSIVGTVLGVMNVFSGIAGYTILSHSGTPSYKIHHFRLLISLLSVYKKGGGV